MAQKHITLTKVGALSLASGEMLTHLRVLPNCWISVQAKHTCSNITSFKKRERRIQCRVVYFQLLTQFDFSAIKEKNLDGGSTAESYGKQWFT